VKADGRALADLAAFARLELDSHDVEPWAEIIAAVDLPREQRTWLMTLYNTHDDLHSAWASMRRWPTPAHWATADDRHDAAAYNCTQERRNLRGGRVLLRHASYAAALAGRSEEEWMRLALTTGRPGLDFAALTRHMRGVWGVGRQSAFEWAEFAGKVLDLPVDAADGQLWESSGPRKCLERLFYLDNPTPTELDDAAHLARDYLLGEGVDLAWVDFETIICDFNVMREGRYYPGRHLAALREEILTLPDEGDRALLDRAWRSFVPEPWAEIVPGINPDLMPVYKRTGRMVTRP
jgi:hypothetical protein